MEEERESKLIRQKIRAEELQQLREEEERFTELKRAAQVWSECQRLRKFVADWERTVEAKSGPIQSGSTLDGWRRWVIHLVDERDPLLAR